MGSPALLGPDRPSGVRTRPRRQPDPQAGRRPGRDLVPWDDVLGPPLGHPARSSVAHGGGSFMGLAAAGRLLAVPLAGTGLDGRAPALDGAFGGLGAVVLRAIPEVPDGRDADGRVGGGPWNAPGDPRACPGILPMVRMDPCGSLGSRSDGGDSLGPVRGAFGVPDRQPLGGLWLVPLRRAADPAGVPDHPHPQPSCAAPSPRIVPGGPRGPGPPRGAAAGHGHRGDDLPADGLAHRRDRGGRGERAGAGAPFPTLDGAAAGWAPVQRGFPAAAPGRDGRAGREAPPRRSVR